MISRIHSFVSRAAATAALCAVLAALAVHLAPKSHAQVVAVGDSFCSGPLSWTHFLEADYGMHVKSLCQSGRFATNYDIPRDLNPIDHDQVVYHLGGNDATYGNVQSFREHFRVHVYTLIAKGFDVLVLVPPNWESKPFINQIRSEIGIYCFALEAYQPNATCYDLKDIWEPSMSPDGIHPDVELSQMIASVIYNKLESLP